MGISAFLGIKSWKVSRGRCPAGNCLVGIVCQKKDSVLRFFHLTLPYSILLYIFCVSLGPRVFSPGPQTAARLGGSSTDFPRKDLSALAPTSFMALIAVIYMAVMQLGSRGLDAV